MSWQMTESQQLQLNYTRRLRRQWGGQLNSFRDTRAMQRLCRSVTRCLHAGFSATPSLNYLKNMDTALAPRECVLPPHELRIQRISYKNSADGLFYSTSMNVAKSLSTGLEVTLKNNPSAYSRPHDIGNAYYYKSTDSPYDIDGQTVTDNADHNFMERTHDGIAYAAPTTSRTGDRTLPRTPSDNARLPPGQLFRGFGSTQELLQQAITLSVNCRDLLNTRKWGVVHKRRKLHTPPAQPARRTHRQLHCMELR